jgi:centromeric protein E
LIDLAGSERINDHDSKAEVYSETGYINKSLFVLANVINKLADSKGGYIPYRDSKLTRLLSQSLGGNALTAIICAISPAAINYYQTLSTLRFATRAKIIKIKAEALYKHASKDEIEFYKREIMRLKQEIEVNSESNKTKY